LVSVVADERLERKHFAEHRRGLGERRQRQRPAAAWARGLVPP
jgi:hypothetical protein